MSTDPIAVLEAIVAEVAGAGQPFSADSYLPPHLVHDARMAIEAESKVATEWKAREAHEAILLARLAKADEVIADLRKSNSDLAKAAIAGIEITDKERQEVLEKHGHSPLVFDPAGRFIDQSIFGPGNSHWHPVHNKTLSHWQAQQAEFNQPEIASQSRTIKYDPKACADSVRGMKECDA